MKQMKKVVSLIVTLGVLGGLLTPLFAVDPKPAQVGNNKQLININSADARQLEALPRVGPKMAQRILEYRKANSGFKKIQDLMKVKGIGQKTFDQLKDQVTI